MQYVCKKNFTDGKDKSRQLVKYKVGEEYKGERAEEFLAAGMIESADKLDEKSIGEIKALIDAKKSELIALEERLKILSEKAAARGQSESANSSNGESADDEPGDLELEKANEEMPRGLSKKEQKAWHKKHG